MVQERITPGEVEVRAWFRKHNGPRMFCAGIGLQFHSDQSPGIHFKVEIKDEFKSAISEELQRSMRKRFPHRPTTGSIWVTHFDAVEHETNWWSVTQATRIAVEQAYVLNQPLDTEA